jgi:hypothetical protein
MLEARMDEQSVLSERERDVLAVVCDALHPALAAGPGEDAALFAASASDLGVPAAAAEALALLAPAQQKELKQFLRVIDSALLGLFVCRTAKGVRAMSAEQRVALLLALTRSPIPQLRSGFQALKRLSCFLYYSAADAEGGNRVWRGIGYQPSQLPAAVERSVNVTRITESTTIDADVCVVGSGAGGGVVAAELASRGLRVVVLEAGPGDQAPDFEQREREGTQRLYLDSGLTSSRDLGVAILAGACLGGGTAVNWQTSLRTPDFIRDEWTDSSGCDLFTSPRFSRALDVVTSRSGCSTSESIVNANNEVVRRGCKTLGYEWSPIARNSRGCDDSQCGHCIFGCRLGAKQSTVQTFLRDAQQHGDTTIIAECSARRVLIRRRGNRPHKRWSRARRDGPRSPGRRRRGRHSFAGAASPIRDHPQPSRSPSVSAPHDWGGGLLSRRDRAVAWTTANHIEQPVRSSRRQFRISARIGAAASGTVVAQSAVDRRRALPASDAAIRERQRHHRSHPRFHRRPSARAA